MRTRAASSLAVVTLALAATVASSQGDGLSERMPVFVGSLAIPAQAVNEAAKRTDGGGAGANGQARSTAAGRLIEAAWLRREAARLEVRASRGSVADALAGPDGRGIPAAFERYHVRHRSVTRCLASHHDPYADRCGNQPAAADAACRWIGEATLCRVTGTARPTWLVVEEVAGRRATVARSARRLAGLLPARLRKRVRGRSLAIRRGAFDVRLRTKRDALAVGRALYLDARAARGRRTAAARAERAHRARAEAAKRRLAGERERRAQAAKRRRERMADPLLSLATASRTSGACRRYRRATEPYSFGVGMQDPEGQADALIAARRALARQLGAAAADSIDRRKLAPLLADLRGGDRALAAIRAATAAGVSGLDRLYGALSRYDRATKREAASARRLGLGRCL